MTDINPFDARTILDGIRRWVEIETPTEAPAQVDKLADLVANGYRDLPATIERIAGRSGCGDHLVARSSWGQDAPGILVLSHLDTVHPIGFIERLPFKIEGDSAFGPGIYDMKGGAYLAYHAFRQACAQGGHSPLGVTQLYVSDEEIGSPTSRALIEQEGRKAKYVLVTEPARDGGKIVTGRKGVARFEIYIKGVPSHAGTRPEDGRSAIRELGNIIQTLEGMNDLKRGVSVNVGVVRGGTKPNVIPEEAYAEVDMRVPTIADSDELVPENPRPEIPHRGRQRQGDRRTQPSALRKGQCRRGACTNTPKRWRPRSASSSWIPRPAAAPTATSPRRIPRRSTDSASTARAHIPITSSCTFRRSNRGRGCCTGCTRRCDDGLRSRVRRSEHGDGRRRVGASARLVLRPQQGAQASAITRPIWSTTCCRTWRSISAAVAAPCRLAELFEGEIDDVRLEIGFGGGEHLIAEAQAFPQTGSSAASRMSTAWRRS